jgi:hypothetical protein
MRLPVTQSQRRADTARSTINQFELSTCSEQYSIHVRIAINEVIELTAEVARCGRCHGRLVVVMSRCVPCVAWALLCECTVHADPSQPRFVIRPHQTRQFCKNQTLNQYKTIQEKIEGVHRNTLQPSPASSSSARNRCPFVMMIARGLTEQTGRRFRWVGGWGGRVGGRG